MTLTDRRGFTLVELLVVVAMIAVIMGAMTTSVSAARERARVQKATAEVKAVAQAILGYENWDTGSGTYELPTFAKPGVDVDKDSLGFLLGNGGTAKSGGKIPVLLMAALRDGKKMVDPWGTAYRVTIEEKPVKLKVTTATGEMKTGFFMPNFYRISEGER